MTAQPLPYDRAPSRELLTLLQPSGLLEPLLALSGQILGGLAMDVHFRRNNEIYVYWGRTRILIVQLLWDGVVKITADGRYAAQQCAKGLFGTWRIGEPGLSRALDAYLHNVEVHSSFTTGEGTVQAQWSLVRDPWVPFDREAVLGYESTAHREKARAFPEVESAWNELWAIYESSQKEAESRKTWEKPPTRRKRDKIDQLAIDAKGQLVLIELKDASSEAGDSLRHAPFQLLRYVWAWHCVLDDVRGGLQQLIDVRVAVGLTPDVPWLTGGVRPVVGFGCVTPHHYVKRKYCKALKVVNQYLPPGVPDIETWQYTDAGLRRVREHWAGQPTA